jgi:CRISPR-associated endonuclease/helicase Cas3
LAARYLIERAASLEQTLEQVAAIVESGGKVLWVRNQVDWANKTYELCRTRFDGVPVEVYHSRFRYVDRSRRHRRVIDAFQQPSRPAILVASQVAEMSLDLSADLLVTDLAPIAALIQRLGRLNRVAIPTAPKLALVCPLPGAGPKYELPYEKQDLLDAERWVDELVSLDGGASQRELSERFATCARGRTVDLRVASERATFFAGRWETRPGTTRAEGHTAAVILEQDLRNCCEKGSDGRPTRNWIRAHEVSIPIRDVMRRWERINAVLIAPASEVDYDYDKDSQEGTGAKWRDS